MLKFKRKTSDIGIPLTKQAFTEYLPHTRTLEKILRHVYRKTTVHRFPNNSALKPTCFAIPFSPNFLRHPGARDYAIPVKVLGQHRKKKISALLGLTNMLPGKTMKLF